MAVALSVCVARPLRFVQPGDTVEVTCRTIHGRLLLRPSPALNAGILAVLGRGLARYAVELHGFAFLSNHYHLLATVADGQELARFMAFVNRNISELVGRLHDWRGPMWARRYRSIAVVDDASQVARLRYVLGQGCQEGLVTSPMIWPGVHCARALVGRERLAGVWLDRSGLYHARRDRGGEVDESEFQTRYEVRLSPLPCWAGLSAAEWRARCAGLVADVEDEARLVNARMGRVPMGAAAVCAQDPHARPRSSKRSPAPLVHAATRKARRLYKAMYRAFVDAFAAASARLRTGGDRLAVFPDYSFPAPGAFVRPAVVVASSA